MVKREKVLQTFFPRLSEKFFLLFTSYEMHRNSKNYQSLVENSKTYSEILTYCNWNGV